MARILSKGKWASKGKEMLKQLEPKRILIYGNRLTELEGYKNLQWFEPYTNKWNKKKGR